MACQGRKWTVFLSAIFNLSRAAITSVVGGGGGGGDVCSCVVKLIPWRTSSFIREQALSLVRFCSVDITILSSIRSYPHHPHLPISVRPFLPITVSPIFAGSHARSLGNKTFISMELIVNDTTT